MSRTPNDDRSDTMNPNNDAYGADQENRYGSDDYWDGDAAVAREKRAPPTDTRFGADPHPILGRRSNRLPSLSVNFEGTYDSRPTVPKIVPFHETLALAFATEKSEGRDRALAADELMTVADWLVTTALAIVARQGNEATLNRGADGAGSTLTFTCGSNSLVVRTSKEFEVVFVASSAYRFSKLRWHYARPVERGYPKSEPYEEAHPRAKEIVGYEFDPGKASDPAQGIYDIVRSWGLR